MKRACQGCGAIAECEMDMELSGLELCADCMTDAGLEFQCAVCGLPVCREEAERSLAVAEQFGIKQTKPRVPMCANCTINELFDLLNARLEPVSVVDVAR